METQVDGVLMNVSSILVFLHNTIRASLFTLRNVVGKIRKSAGRAVSSPQLVISRQEPLSGLLLRALSVGI